MTYDEWAPLYRRLIRTYSRIESGEQCAAFFEALRDLPVADVQQAVGTVIRTGDRFPVPAKIREQVTIARAAAAREQSVVPNFEPISDEKRDELVALIRGAKEKIFGRGM